MGSSSATRSGPDNSLSESLFVSPVGDGTSELPGSREPGSWHNSEDADANGFWPQPGRHDAGGFELPSAIMEEEVFANDSMLHVDPRLLTGAENLPSTQGFAEASSLFQAPNLNNSSEDQAFVTKQPGHGDHAESPAGPSDVEEPASNGQMMGSGPGAANMHEGEAEEVLPQPPRDTRARQGEPKPKRKPTGFGKPRGPRVIYQPIDAASIPAFALKAKRSKQSTGPEDSESSSESDSDQSLQPRRLVAPRRMLQDPPRKNPPRNIGPRGRGDKNRGNRGFPQHQYTNFTETWMPVPDITDDGTDWIRRYPNHVIGKPLLRLLKLGWTAGSIADLIEDVTGQRCQADKLAKRVSIAKEREQEKRRLKYERRNACREAAPSPSIGKPVLHEGCPVSGGGEKRKAEHETKSAIRETVASDVGESILNESGPLSGGWNEHQAKRARKNARRETVVSDDGKFILNEPLSEGQLTGSGMRRERYPRQASGPSFQAINTSMSMSSGPEAYGMPTNFSTNHPSDLSNQNTPFFFPEGGSVQEPRASGSGFFGNFAATSSSTSLSTAPPSAATAEFPWLNDTMTADDDLTADDFDFFAEK